METFVKEEICCCSGKKNILEEGGLLSDQANFPLSDRDSCSVSLAGFEPLVSIVIPVYNGANFAREAIESALDQTYTNTEVIVVNDGSNDNGKTREVALSFGNSIKYLEKRNGGVSSALNAGIKVMKGEYFSWLSHDDLYLPYKIKNQIDLLAGLSEKKTIVYSLASFVNQATGKQQKIQCPKEFQSNVYGMIVGTQIHGNSLLVPAECFKQFGNFDINLKTVQDNELWLRFHQNGVPFILLDDDSVVGRIHGEQTSVVIKDSHTFEKEFFYREVVNKYYFEDQADHKLFETLLTIKGQKSRIPNWESIHFYPLDKRVADKLFIGTIYNVAKYAGYAGVSTTKSDPWHYMCEDITDLPWKEGQIEDIVIGEYILTLNEVEITKLLCELHRLLKNESELRIVANTFEIKESAAKVMWKDFVIRLDHLIDNSPFTKNRSIKPADLLCSADEIEQTLITCYKN